MMQFEELMDAAKAVSPASRPLNLYYALAQAGMAIAAVRAADPWSFSGHGLKLGDVSENGDLANIKVSETGDGAFQRVSGATGSAGITAPVSLEALWDSLPDFQDVALRRGQRAAALDILPRIAPSDGPSAHVFVPAGQLRDGPDLPQRAYDLLAEYPAAAGAAIPAEPGSIVPPPRPEGRWQISLHWPSQQMWQESMEAQVREFFDRLAPEDRYRDDRYLRPAINGSTPPSPLMTWWLLLYSFSMLARYRPRRWIAFLNLDRPGCAVALQFALEVALGAIPHLVLEALDGEAMLLTRPLRI
jgi:hypothetical protein